MMVIVVMIMIQPSLSFRVWVFCIFFWRSIVSFICSWFPTSWFHYQRNYRLIIIDISIPLSLIPFLPSTLISFLLSSLLSLLLFLLPSYLHYLLLSLLSTSFFTSSYTSFFINFSTSLFNFFYFYFSLYFSLYFYLPLGTQPSPFLSFPFLCSAPIPSPFRPYPLISAPLLPSPSLSSPFLSLHLPSSPLLLFLPPISFVFYELSSFSSRPLCPSYFLFIFFPALLERKGISDLFQSFASGRLYNQAESMGKHYEHPCLLIEFHPDKSFNLQVRNRMKKNWKETWKWR